MPKIPDEVTKTVVYLYRTREDAEAGKPFGGSGFLLGMPSGLADIMSAYVVTNWHVALQGGASVVRVNKKNGGVDIFELSPDEWDFMPGGYDIAIAHLPLNEHIHDVVALGIKILLQKDDLKRLEIGPGDEIFMMGRFVDHDGAATNVPAGRFGNISVMPQPIKQPTGSLEPSFILDVHSRTGYSGAPVFVYRNAALDLRFPDIRTRLDNWFLKLLGIHWGQFPERWDIENDTKDEIEGVSLSNDAKYIKGLSGMTMVVPSWAILELLDMPKVKQRRIEEAQRELAENQMKPIAEMEGEADAVPHNPSHKEDFMNLLGAAAKVKTPNA